MQGHQGDQGEQGIQGVQGETGAGYWETPIPTGVTVTGRWEAHVYDFDNPAPVSNDIAIDRISISLPARAPVPLDDLHVGIGGSEAPPTPTPTARNAVAVAPMNPLRPKAISAFIRITFQRMESCLPSTRGRSTRHQSIRGKAHLRRFPQCGRDRPGRWGLGHLGIHRALDARRATTTPPQSSCSFLHDAGRLRDEVVVAPVRDTPDG